MFYYNIGLTKQPPNTKVKENHNLMRLSWNYDFVFTNLSKNKALLL